jgi:hypothetical protein
VLFRSGYKIINMKSNITKRTIALNQSQIDEFLSDHIPYRYSALCAWKEKLWNKDNLNTDFKICAFEAALLHSRLFIQFLGLGIDKSLHLIENRTYFNFKGKTDEVKIIDLNGKWVEIKDLNNQDKTYLEKVCFGASKATAHFTYDSKHGMTPEVLNKAIDIIVNLLKTNLYILHKKELIKYQIKTP